MAIFWSYFYRLTQFKQAFFTITGLISKTHILHNLNYYFCSLYPLLSVLFLSTSFVYTFFLDFVLSRLPRWPFFTVDFSLFLIKFYRVAENYCDCSHLSSQKQCFRGSLFDNFSNRFTFFPDNLSFLICAFVDLENAPKKNAFKIKFDKVNHDSDAIASLEQFPGWQWIFNWLKI